MAGLRPGALALALALALAAPAAAFEAVPCNASAVNCGMNFFREVYDQFQAAQREVVIMPFFIKPKLKIFDSGAGRGADRTLEDLIVQAIKRGVHVWVLGWDNAASEKFLPYHQDSVYEQLFEAAGQDHGHLHLMLDTSRSWLSSVYYLPHIKAYSFDRRVAYVGGLDFAENRLDSPQHLRPDPRLLQVPVDASHMTGNEKPWEDAMVKIDGPAAEHVAMVLVERWWTYCKSEGYLRSQASRPLDAVADAIWGVSKSFSQSVWKNYQCSQLPSQGRLGILSVAVSGDAKRSAPTQHRLQISIPPIQSGGLPKPQPQVVTMYSGSTAAVDVVGLRALDRALPKTIDFEVSGKKVTAGTSKDVVVELPGGDTLHARWLPNGVSASAATGQQTCKLVLSGDRDWMGVESPLMETYAEHVKMIREAKRFIFIENQYFSTAFPASSHECMNGNVRGEAVLYSGATNRVGEVLLDRIKRAGRLKEQFSVAVLIPLGTEPGSFYPNLRGTYCFEQAVEDFWKHEQLQSNWRDYFSFFFLANAVPVPESLGGPGAAFYGIFTHTKAIVVDDEVALLGSANINDRSLNGDRDAEVGVKVTGGSLPKELRETLMEGHLGSASLCDPRQMLASLHAVANANARELHEKMGILFPEGIFTRGSQTQQFFGLKGVLKVPTLDYSNAYATLRYPDSRVVAGGGGLDTFQWFAVKGAAAPQLRGLLFPWSRQIWGLPKMTQVTQMFSNEFNWRRLSQQSEEGEFEAPDANSTLFA